MGDDASTEAVLSFLRETDVGKVKAGVLDRDARYFGDCYGFFMVLCLRPRSGSWFLFWSGVYFTVHGFSVIFTGYGFFCGLGVFLTGRGLFTASSLLSSLSLRFFQTLLQFRHIGRARGSATGVGFGFGGGARNSTLKTQD